MFKAPEKLIKERIELADGRYLIFYTFAPANRLASSRRADPIPDGKEPKSAEEN